MSRRTRPLATRIARTTVPTLAGLAATMLVAVASAAAQQPAPSPSAPPRPAFENLRFREDWSRAPQGDAFDPLKHIALADSGAVWLSLGGHVRARAERAENFLGGGTGVRTDNFGLVRAQLHADLHVGSNLRLFVEGRQALAQNRDLPGGNRAIDRNDLDWGNAFAEVSGTVLGRSAVLRLGRQELSMGRERILSPLDWANVRRIFQGATLEARQGAFTVGAFVTRPVTLLPTAADVPDVHTLFWGTTIAWQRPGQATLVEGAVLVKATDAAGATPFAQRTTLTSRIVLPLEGTPLTAELEGGAQVGASGNTAVRAFMFASDLTWSRREGWAPALTVGYDWSSGTSLGDVPQSSTWDQLYPLAHAYAGYADVLGRRNLVEERIVAQVSPTAALRLRLAAHAFQRAHLSDAVYDVTGAVLRASVVGASGDIGGEFDATAQWRWGRHLRVDGGVARFTPGQFMRDTGAALPYTWMFLSVTTTF